VDITAILNNLTSLGAAVRAALSVVSVLAGLVLFASAGRSLVKGQRGEEGPNLMAVGVQLFIGAACIQIARSIEDTRVGLLAGAGSEVRSMMAYAVPAAGNGVWSLLMSTCLVWIATIGAIAVFRGFLLWNKSGSGDSPGGSPGDFFWRGIWHIFGGAVCINIGM